MLLGCRLHPYFLYFAVYYQLIHLTYLYMGLNAIRYHLLYQFAFNSKIIHQLTAKNMINKEISYAI